MAKIKKVESQVDGEQPTIIVLDDGTEVNLEEIDGGFMRQSDYTKKTQALADQKKALETAQVNQQVDTTINSQPEATNGNADMTKMYLDMKMNQLKIAYGESFDEVAVLNKAVDMLKKGVSPADIDFDFIARGLMNTDNNTNVDSLREQIRKEEIAKLKQQGVDTSSIIASGDTGNVIDDGTFGLSPDELNYCRATGEDPEDYAKWKKRLGR